MQSAPPDDSALYQQLLGDVNALHAVLGSPLQARRAVPRRTSRRVAQHPAGSPASLPYSDSLCSVDSGSDWGSESSDDNGSDSGITTSSGLNGRGAGAASLLARQTGSRPHALPPAHLNRSHHQSASHRRLEDSNGSSSDEGTEAEEDEEQGDEGCTSSGSVGSDERDGRDGVGGSAGLLTEKELLAQLGMEGLEVGDISSLRDMVDSFVGVFGAADSPAASGPVDTQPPLSDVSEDEVGQGQGSERQGPQGQGCHWQGFQQQREFVGTLLSPSAPQAAVKTAQSQPAAAARATQEPASAVMGSTHSGTQGLGAWPLTPLRATQRAEQGEQGVAGRQAEEGAQGNAGQQADQGMRGAARQRAEQGVRGTTAGQADTFLELAPGEPLPPGRLGSLYAALAANRALSAHLRGVVLPRVDRALDANWSHITALKAAPELHADRRRNNPEERIRGIGGEYAHRLIAILRHPRLSLIAQAQKAPLLSLASPFSTLRCPDMVPVSLRQGYHLPAAADPLRRLGGPANSQRTAAASRFWLVQGCVPEPNSEAVTLSRQLASLPSSYERTRWSARLVARLQRGVQAEVHAQLCSQVLQDLQAAATSAQQQAPGGQHAPGPGLKDLSARFAEIQGIKATSPQAHTITAAFTDEQWERVSLAHVRERSPLDCKWERVARELGGGRTAAQCLQAWLKNCRPEGHATRGRQQWSIEDTARLEQLVALHGTSWVKISDAFGGKYDRHQVRDRWHGQAAQHKSRHVGRWSADEDTRLAQAVSQLGAKWREVSGLVGSRTPQQCRERYCNVVNPNLNAGPFTEAECDALRRAVTGTLRENGRIVWTKVAGCVPGRTDDMCRRAWKQLSASGQQEQTVQKQQKLGEGREVQQGQGKEVQQPQGKGKAQGKG
ncbi:hypothetical protein QJQ45_016258 [Haematococcus lacustris]|nr:hypothetical protein QJQ45_016258 [Haematococcus lacustris]